METYVAISSNGTNSNTTFNNDKSGLHPDRPGMILPGHSTLTMILVPIGVLIIIATVVMFVIFFVRRTRMERLRHRLMPLYSYDPDEDNADWEAELIEDEREQQRALTANDTNLNSSTEPRLSFLRSPPEA